MTKQNHFNKTINLGYSIQIHYEVSDSTFFFEGSEFTSEQELYAFVADRESISNVKAMKPTEYILQDRDVFLKFKDEFEIITLVSGIGVVFRNEQYLSFEHGIFIERDQYVVDGIDFYDWFTNQLIN